MKRNLIFHNHCKALLLSFVFSILIQFPPNLLAQCNKYHGKKLSECINNSSHPEKIKILVQLSLEQRKEFLKQQTFETYQKFLNAYSEREWLLFFENLTSQEKKYWPKTIREQKNALNEIEEKSHAARNIILVAQLTVDTLFPPAMIIHVGEFYYLYRYNKHPIVAREIRRRFNNYAHETFKLTTENSKDIL